MKIVIRPFDFIIIVLLLLATRWWSQVCYYLLAGFHTSICMSYKSQEITAITQHAWVETIILNDRKITELYSLKIIERIAFLIEQVYEYKEAFSAVAILAVQFCSWRRLTKNSNKVLHFISEQLSQNKEFSLYNNKEQSLYSHTCTWKLKHTCQELSIHVIRLYLQRDWT